MRILFLTTNSSLLDGINRHILSVSSAVNARNDCHVAVVTVHPKGELNYALKKNGVKAYSLDAKNGHQLRIIWRFMRVIRDFKPDIVHIHVLAFMERVVLALFFPHIPCVCTIHGLPDDQFRTGTVKLRGGFGDSLSSLIETKCTDIFRLENCRPCYISIGVRDALNGNGPVISNPLPSADCCHGGGKLHQLLGVPSTTPIIGSACRFAWIKNLEKMAEVFCRVLQNLPQVHCVILGSGDAAISQAVSDAAYKAGVSDRFHLPGAKKNAIELIADMDCFVMTSRSEGLPTSLLEAIVVNTPIVYCMGGGGLLDMSQLGIASCVASDDINAMVDKISWTVTHTQAARDVTVRNLEIAKKNFGIESITNALVDFYYETLGD